MKSLSCGHIAKVTFDTRPPLCPFFPSFIFFFFKELFIFEEFDKLCNVFPAIYKRIVVGFPVNRCLSFSHFISPAALPQETMDFMGYYAL